MQLPASKRLELVSRQLNCGRSHGYQHACTAQTHSRRSTCRTAALPEWVRQVFDFESWAPRSSRVWRLQQYQRPDSDEQQQEAGAGATDMQSLTDRIKDLQQSSSSSATGNASSGDAAVADPMGSSSNSSSGLGSSGLKDDLPPSATKSFSDVDDSELSAALGQRIRQIATSTGSYSDEVEEEEMRQPLTGPELRALLLSKYGKSYDMSFVRRQVPGMKTFVCLNLMWVHMEQRSLQQAMSEAQYMEKLDGVATLVNLLGQTDKVRAFLKAPAKSQKGLPARPVVGTAVSIRFDLPDAVIQEWFGQGYY